MWQKNRGYDMIKDKERTEQTVSRKGESFMANAFENVRVPLIAYALIILVVSCSYPLLMLMDNSSSQKNPKRPSHPQRPTMPGRNGEVR